MFISSCGFKVELDPSSSNTSGPNDFTANRVPVPNFLVSAFPSPGTYSENIDVSINSSGFKDVYYCISSTSECCAPVNLYSSSSILISNEDDISTYSPGNYCLSFIGIGENFQTAVQEYQYVIDDSIPAISSRFTPLIGTNETLFIQTNQLNTTIRTDSSLFGQVDHFYSTHNLGNQDPGAFSGCEDIYNSFPYVSDGIEDTNGDLEVDAQSVGFVVTPINRSLGVRYYGENFIVSVMRFQDLINGDRFGCHVNKVVLKDFPIFRQSLSGSYSTGTNANTIMEFQGGVSNFGRFQGSLTGSTQTALTPYKLKTNFVDIVN